MPPVVLMVVVLFAGGSYQQMSVASQSMAECQAFVKKIPSQIAEVNAKGDTGPKIIGYVAACGTPDKAPKGIGT